MIFTNEYELPEPLFNALTHDGYVKRGDISVTSLIMPPRIRVLSQRHDERLVGDVSERLWMLLGTAVHAILENAGGKYRDDQGYIDAFAIENPGPPNDPDSLFCRKEIELETQCEEWTVTGTADLWEYPGTLSDYKITSVWSVISGKPKPEWIAQLNLYGLMAHMQGYAVDKLQICAILRDHSKLKALGGKGYPKVPFRVVPVPMWSQEKAATYLKQRVRLHQEAEGLADNYLPFCTPEERWERPTVYAVRKTANKTATKLHEDKEAAAEHAETLAEKTGKKHVVDTRTGESVRCESYCAVAPFCNQYREVIHGTDSQE